MDPKQPTDNETEAKLNTNHESKHAIPPKIRPRDIHDTLKANLPSTTAIIHSGTNPNKIEIKEGLWRGFKFSAHIIEEGGVIVSDGKYYIPSFIGHVIIFVSAILLFSSIAIIGVSIALKQFTLFAAVPGAIPGAIISSWIDRAIIASVKRSWSSELVQVIKAVKKLGIEPEAP